MKTAELKATVRETIGAKSAKKLRKEDKVPAVVYGAKGTQHVEVDYIPMTKLIHSTNLYLINLETGKDSKRVIIQDAQYHPITDRLIHVDFLEAVEGRVAKLNIPVEITGKSKGVLNGGMLVVKMRYVKVKGIPSELPEVIKVDITDLEIGKSIKIKDIKGFEMLDPENSVIVRVKTARNIEVVADLEEGEEGEEGAEGTEGAEGAEGAAPAAEGSAPAAE